MLKNVPDDIYVEFEYYSESDTKRAHEVDLNYWDNLGFIIIK